MAKRQMASFARSGSRLPRFVKGPPLSFVLTKRTPPSTISSLSAPFVFFLCSLRIPAVEYSPLTCVSPCTFLHRFSMTSLAASLIVSRAPPFSFLCFLLFSPREVLPPFSWVVSAACVGRCPCANCCRPSLKWAFLPLPLPAPFGGGSVGGGGAGGSLEGR